MKLLITQIKLEHRLSALLQLHLHSRNNTRLKCIGQIQLHDRLDEKKHLSFAVWCHWYKRFDDMFPCLLTSHFHRLSQCVFRSVYLLAIYARHPSILEQSLLYNIGYNYICWTRRQNPFTSILSVGRWEVTWYLDRFDVCRIYVKVALVLLQAILW